MTREEAIKEINKVFEPAFANYIIMALGHPEIISPQQFAEQMREIAKDKDREFRHVWMDKLMVKVLNQLGYEEGTQVFDSTMKWYA